MYKSKIIGIRILGKTSKISELAIVERNIETQKEKTLSPMLILAKESGVFKSSFIAITAHRAFLRRAT